jgi:prepilin-type N-terminal cleavage/methylation domain-containing protein
MSLAWVTRASGGRDACPTGPGWNRGFTLIEVLIGILVLALGLLGIGAIIPVVVREQRIAADVTQGRSVLNDVRAAMLQLNDLRPDEPLPTYPDAYGRNAWDTWIRDVNWSGPVGDPEEFLWQPWPGDDTTGTITFTDPIAPPPPQTTPEFRLTLADRLWPSKSSQVISILPPGSDPFRPQFVWDVVGRRVEYGDQYARVRGTGSPDYDLYAGKQDVLQVAVFVRRVDPGVRLPRRANSQNVTLLDVLTGSSRCTIDEVRMAVAFDDGTRQLVQNAGPNAPTYGRYAPPLILTVDANDTLQERDVIRLDVSAAQDLKDYRLAAQAGQKIVDNLGNVYTVVGYDENDPAGPADGELFVTPPVPSWVQPPSSGNTSPRRLRQIVFTPQIPVAVEVVTIRRPVVRP